MQDSNGNEFAIRLTGKTKGGEQFDWLFRTPATLTQFLVNCGEGSVEFNVAQFGDTVPPRMVEPEKVYAVLDEDGEGGVFYIDEGEVDVSGGKLIGLDNHKVRRENPLEALLGGEF